MKIKDKYDFTVEDNMFLSVMNVRKDSDRLFYYKDMQRISKNSRRSSCAPTAAIPPLEADYGNITTTNPYSCVIHFLLAAVLLPLPLSMGSPPASAIQFNTSA